MNNFLVNHYRQGVPSYLGLGNLGGESAEGGKKFENPKAALSRYRLPIFSILKTTWRFPMLLGKISIEKVFFHQKKA